MPRIEWLRLQLDGCCASRLRQTYIKHVLSLVSCICSSGICLDPRLLLGGTKAANTKKHLSTSEKKKACNSRFQIEILLMGSRQAFILQH